MFSESILLLDILENNRLTPSQQGPSVIFPKFGIRFLKFQDILTSVRIIIINIL